jgi:type III restriction enzyme
MKKRQEIGRGLRLAVDQNGERKYGHEINTLTVMANESYEDFAKALQKEIAEEEDIKFGVIEKHTFANIARKKEDGNYEYLGQKSSEAIWNDLKDKGYIDKDGKVTDGLKRDLKDNKVEVAEEFKESKDKIVSILKKVAGNLNIKDADKREEIELNKGIFLGEDFKKLWDKIKYKTTYSVEFDTDNLIEKCSDEIKRNLRVDKAKLIYEKGLQKISAAGIETKEVVREASVYYGHDYTLPDILTYLQNETNLTRKTLVKILKKSDRLQDFKNNPQKFMDEVSFIIKNKMRHLIVDGIKYEKIGGEEYYSQELFEDRELKGYLNDNMIESEKSVYKYVVYDSTNEKNFAQRFEDNESIKVYAKLPDWFKIDTPLGTYNPDWAVLVDKDEEEKLYFVLETKANILWEALRPSEDAKIRCGEKHFEALGNTVKFKKVDDFNDFIESV